MSKTTQATVRILISHDYCHFEISKTIQCDTIEDSESVFGHSEISITNKEIDDVRKDCQRLADKAVGQYKTAKEKAIKRTGNNYERMQLEKEVREINMKKEEYLTPEDKAKIKALEDYNQAWRYNYMDDEEYEIGNE